MKFIVSANISAVIIFLVCSRILHFKNRKKMFMKTLKLFLQERNCCLIEKFVTGKCYKNKLKSLNGLYYSPKNN